MLLQALSAVGYYMTSPFPVNVPIALALLINGATLIFLWIHCATLADRMSNQYRWSRWVFTGTLFLLEILIGLTDTPVSKTELQGLFNDAEVLSTGILLGVLWHEELLRLKFFSKS